MSAQQDGVRESWRWFVATVLLVVLSACGQDATDPACVEADCLTPPAAVCDGATLVRFSAFGTCEDDVCAYARIASACQNGCSDGACVGAPTCEDGCTTAPAPFCDGDAVVRSTGPGTCEDGTCAFEQTRDDCTAGGRICSEGRCVVPCGGAVCDVPPEAFCDGDVLVAYDADEQCVDNTCRYTPTRQDCGESGGRCQAGACLPPDLCAGIGCANPPPAACDGTVAVTYAPTGTCDDEDGSCNYAPRRTNCAATPGGVCIAGACEQFDACQDVACDSPPPGRCEGNLAITSGEGTCEDGTCSYAETEEDCAASDLFCFRGVCGPADPCQGVLCDAAPAPACEGDIRVLYSPRGTCSDGTCSYNAVREDCARNGGRCEDGACIAGSACAEVICEAPPEPVCVDAFVLRGYDLPGRCSGGVCTYPAFEQDCALAGGVCTDGVCDVSVRCVGVTCETPPADFCAGRTAVRHAASGTCTSGVCRYETTEQICALGTDCVGGRCVDRCLGTTCGPPPASVCDGDTLVVSRAGVCGPTGCTWPQDRVPCDGVEGGYCRNGACRVFDFCELRTCDTPPAPTCEGRVAVTSQLPGSCVDDACEYTTNRLDCALTSRFCFAGACVATDPCVGVACDTPPPDSCDGTNRLQYASTGLCAAGTCDYTVVATDCADTGATCRDGACVDAALCSGVVCDDPPPATCDGRVAVQFADGRCTGGACQYGITRQDCALTGGFCDDGSCVVADPCQGVTCDRPPADTCDGDLPILYRAGGVCESGRCTWEPTAGADCALTDEVCQDGVCTADPCDDVVCDTPPADVCDDSLIVTWEATGTCRLGVCSYAPRAVRDCADVDRTCVDGTCAGEDPCEGISCTELPAPTCQGPEVATATGPGVCVAGVCTYPLALTDCGDPLQFLCEDGACVDSCAGVECPDWEVPTCTPDEERLVFPQTCVLGDCIPRSPIATACQPEFDLCFDGECRNGERCDYLTCPETTSFCNESADTRRFIVQARGCEDGVCLTETIEEACAPGTICDDGVCVPPTVPVVGDLVFSEFRVGVGATGARFVEVYNPSELPISLAGLSLVLNSGGSTAVAGVDVLPAGRSVAWGEAGVPVAEGALVGSWVSAAFNPNAAGDTISLQRAGLTLASLTWDATWPLDADDSVQAGQDLLAFGTQPAGPTGWCPSELALFERVGPPSPTPGENNVRCPLSARRPRLGEVFFNEYLARSAEVGSEENGDWLALRVLGTEDALTFAGLTLEVDDRSWTLVGNRILLGTGEYVVGDGSTAAGGEVDESATGLVIPLARGTMTLRDGDTVLHTLAWDSAQGWPVRVGRSVALSRAIVDPAAIALASSWCTEVQPMENGDLGSPRQLNRVCPPRISCDETNPCADRGECAGEVAVAWSDAACVDGFCDYAGAEASTVCGGGFRCVFGICEN